MPRADGRIEQGQKLTSAISARAWNRAQQAADIVLGKQYGFDASRFLTARLPGVRGHLGSAGYFGQAVAIGHPQLTDSGFVDVTQHADPRTDTLADFSADEKAFISFTVPDALGMPINCPHIAICCGNRSHEYVVSGFAITRVRVFHYNHRYARLPQEFPGQTEEQITEAQGSLDSTFYGPVKIIGYWMKLTDGVFRFQHSDQSFYPLVYPSFEVRWALVVI